MSESRRSWRKWGEVDPYFGVVSHDRFRRAALDESARRDFFIGGEAHVERVMALVEDGPVSFERGSVLDFGCGVGRLLLPFARRFEHAVGIDISEGMLRELHGVMAEESARNYETHLTLSSLPQGAVFDLVHSYIVLQHIEVREGMRLIGQLLGLVRRQSGIIALHVTFATDASPARRALALGRRWFPPVHWAVNLVKGRPVGAPFMQMNHYPLSDIFRLMHGYGFRCFRSFSTNHGGVYGVMIVGFQAGGEE